MAIKDIKKKPGGPGRMSYKKPLVELKKQIWARMLVSTLDPSKAHIAAGYKDTPANQRRVFRLMAKDPFVQKTIQELLDKAYPVEKKAEDFAALLAKAVSMAKDSSKINEVLATLDTLGKIIGTKAPEQPKKHLHLHANAPGPDVIPSLQLPKN